MGVKVTLGTMAPDVAAWRFRYELEVLVPVRPDHDAKFGQRWGVRPMSGMTYDDIGRVARAKRRERGDRDDLPPARDEAQAPDATLYHEVHERLGIVSRRCEGCKIPF